MQKIIQLFVIFNHIILIIIVIYFIVFVNGKIALRFKVAYIEIWDFSLMQCNTKIDAIEADSIKEINTNAFAVMSSNGIQIMSIKF